MSKKEEAIMNSMAVCSPALVLLIFDLLQPCRVLFSEIRPLDRGKLNEAVLGIVQNCMDYV